MSKGESAQRMEPALERLETPRSPGRTAAIEPQGLDGASNNLMLSVVMAAHNEVRTIETAVSSILALDTAFAMELIVVDDGSTDGTGAVIQMFDDPRLIVLQSRTRRGKGAALLAGATVATGTHLLVFDADLEYSAEDIPGLFEPVVNGHASVVYGSRVPGMRTAFRSFRYTLGSKITTIAANLLFDAWLTDMHTCLKLIPLKLFRELSLGQRGFGLDTEITAEILRRGVRPYEVPCSYRGRTIADGKKISLKDGLECFLVLARVRLRQRVTYQEETSHRLRVLPGMAGSQLGAPEGYAHAATVGPPEMASSNEGRHLRSPRPVPVGTRAR